VPALQSAINNKDASAIALDALKVTADTCGTVAPLATGAAAADTCAVSTGALVAAVETGKILLNSPAAIQQYMDEADTDITNGFIDDAMDYLITGTAVGVPGSDLIANGATLSAQTNSGPITTVGFNDSVNTSEFVGKDGSPVGASVTAYGGQTTIGVFGLVDSTFSEMTPNSTLSVDTQTSGSTVNANNNSFETLMITGNYPSDASAVEDVGTGSRITLDISNDTLSSMSSGTAVTIEAGTTLDKVEASGETVSIGNSADAVVDGAGNGVTAGTSSKVDDDGTGILYMLTTAVSHSLVLTPAM